MNISEIEKNITGPLKEKDIKLLDIKFVVENEHNYLRITIDTIDLKDCVKATKIINPIIDKINIKKDKYFLEVYSKGEDKSE